MWDSEATTVRERAVRSLHFVMGVGAPMGADTATPGVYYLHGHLVVGFLPSWQFPVAYA